MSWPDARDPNFHVLYALAEAWFSAYTQELAFDAKAGPDGVQKFDDPIKFRFGVWMPADGRQVFYIAVLSFDTLRNDGGNLRRWERGYLGFLLDPEPAFVFYTEETADTQDSPERGTMKLRFRLSAKGAEFHVPVKGVAALPPEDRAPVESVPQEVRRFFTGRGKYCWNFQDDEAWKNSAAIVYNTWDAEGNRLPEYDDAGNLQWKAVATFEPTPLTPQMAAALGVQPDADLGERYSTPTENA